MVYDIRTSKIMSTLETDLGCINSITSDELSTCVAIGGAAGSVAILETTGFEITSSIEMMRN